ncbi:VOC family protein [Notoacmeibacter ruber]|uniref:Glyoxalase/bleomycin resistance/extradiol dioxygenase family protein n=1 Tax=Notoacmeibacter ruber TaxID=2670375 RepID=A0A3L7J902_9HYPH|nr:VOC family protein [Notoacmeibacter ruber]RLQ87106.1 glyoxalase/bleomycin resistance/extradiol dioxygenase family protein [Notoacmeibacter ruber]
MNETPALNGVLEAAVYIDDIEAARRFYGELLGLKEMTAAEGRHVFFRCGTTIVLCFIADATRQPEKPGGLPVPPHGAKGPGHICFSANGETLDRWVEHLEIGGIAIESDFRWPNGARSVYVRDPAGNSVEFAEPKLWGLE